MDFSVLAPTLARYGAPLIAQLLDTAAGAAGGPLAGMAVTGVTNFVLARLGAAFNVPADPAALAPAIESAAQSDPAGTATKLQAVQDDHADLIQKAMAQAQIDEANVESARAANAQIVQSGSTSAWILPGLAVVTAISLYAIAGYLVVIGDVQTKFAVFTALLGIHAGVMNFYFGTSKSGIERSDAVTSMLRQQIAPVPIVKPKGR